MTAAPSITAGPRLVMYPFLSRIRDRKGYAEVSVMPTSGGPVVVMLGSGAVRSA